MIRRSKKILGTFMLMLPLMMIGCGKEDSSVSNSSIETTDKSNKNDKKFLSSITGKDEFYGIKVKGPKGWTKIENQEDILLYRMEDTNRNISITVDNISGKTMDEYMGMVKSTLGKVIDLSNSLDGSINIGDRNLKTIDYKYKLQEKEYNIYQACFENNGIVYVFTLGTDEEKIDIDKQVLHDMIENISI